MKKRKKGGGKGFVLCLQKGGGLCQPGEKRAGRRKGERRKERWNAAHKKGGRTEANGKSQKRKKRLASRSSQKGKRGGNICFDLIGRRKKKPSAVWFPGEKEKTPTLTLVETGLGGRKSNWARKERPLQYREKK